MKTVITTGATLCFLLLGGCAAGHIDPADRDTTGAYDGVWTGSVTKPRARRETLPGNWYMNCGWQPFEITLTVIDGRLRLDNLEGTAPVSTKGAFRLDLGGGDTRMVGGVMPGSRSRTVPNANAPVSCTSAPTI